MAIKKLYIYIFIDFNRMANLDFYFLNNLKLAIIEAKLLYYLLYISTADCHSTIKGRNTTILFNLKHITYYSFRFQENSLKQFQGIF